MLSASKLVFRDDGIIDVTRFDSTPEDPVIGYMCGGTISVFSDGDIKVHDCDKVLEAFHVKDIVHFNSNINSYDPEHLTEVVLIIPSESIRFTFIDIEKKQSFAEALSSLDYSIK